MELQSCCRRTGAGCLAKYLGVYSECYHDICAAGDQPLTPRQSGSLYHGAAMTMVEFEALKSLEGRRGRMTFIDGEEVVATIVNITTDLDESRHLIYERVEWSALSHADRGAEAYYASGEELVSCTLAPPVE